MPTAPDAFFTALSDCLAGHITTARHRSRTALPGGYELALLTRDSTVGALQAAPFAPSPTNAARICTARFSPGIALPVATRVLAFLVRNSPALPDARGTRVDPADVARHLDVGLHEQRTDDPGLFVTFGHAHAWLHDNRLGITLGSAGSGGSITFTGPWDAVTIGAVTDQALREFTHAGELATEVSALLPSPWNRVLTDQWHPDAAVILPRHSPTADDPLGRRFSRELRAVGGQLLEQRPDLDMQPFFSMEGAAVALRVTRRERSVPRLVKSSRYVPPRPGGPAVVEYHSEYLPEGFRRPDGS
ncbi:hypothetical protein ACFWXO_13465 [Kitasatospora sp. NPDC059088]|uniref:hypothetical protein n=1 Tax=Kitasatospora sp. NPDC059088 TaxID=3346722 RepID=UPI00367BBDF0